MLRDFLLKRHEEIRRHHEGGATGEEVIAALTDLTDEVIERLYHDVLQRIPLDARWKVEDGLAVAALGGYGRGERSPNSDIDIMFLYRPSLRSDLTGISGEILQRLWDAGFQVGHSARTVADCIAIGKTDTTVRTSLMEARYLIGSRDLFDQFRHRYRRKVVFHRPDQFTRNKIREREGEWEQYGTTTHLLEPNLKKSRGGLRDLHLLQWLALSRYQTGSLEVLKQQGILTKHDFRTLSESREFLWRVRNELHFGARRAQDTLTFEEQERMAGLWGYSDNPNLLAVEQFMQRYYDHTTAMAEITTRYVGAMVPRGWFRRAVDRLTRRRVGEYFETAGEEISILPEFRAAVLGKGSRVLSLFLQAQDRGLDLSVETQDLLIDLMGHWPTDLFSDPPALEVFLSILTRPAGVGTTLRRLHRFRILERIIPPFSRVRGLMQFNLYHKYTVDEHCIRAVEEAEKIPRAGGPLARVFGEIGRKEVLYLGLLLHDLGKGLGGDHSVEGAAFALDVGRRFGLEPAVTEQLVFLVRNHLLMTHLAFRRDLSDEQVILQFAKAVGTPETLRKLYVLTVSDVMAVGPGTLTQWKMDLLSDLFNKTLGLLTGGTGMVAEEERVERIRREVREDPGGAFDPEWLEGQIEAMPVRYLLANSIERIRIDLKRILELSARPVRVVAENDLQRNLTEYSVYTFDGVSPGIFHKITGVLAANGLQIMGATITTWSNQVVVDTFQVEDPDYHGPPDEERLRDIGENITEVLLGQRPLEPPSKAGERIRPDTANFPRIAPVQVEVDNTTSNRYSVVEVFAADRPGLLAVIAQALFKLGVSVHSAKVATHMDQVVDIFHVTDRAGQRILDPDRIRNLKATLTREIEGFSETTRGR